MPVLVAVQTGGHDVTWLIGASGTPSDEMLRRAAMHLGFSVGKAVSLRELLKVRVPHRKTTVIAAGSLLLKGDVSGLYYDS